MLMIDDEADNASVNTKGNDDPTAINKNIRKILKLFSKASYVGFTATPYANIFIDPDSTQEMLDDDLFPRDFIYALEAPTNYIGASRIFPKEGKFHYMIYDMYIGGKGCTTIANTLNAEGHRNWLGNPWRPNGVLDIIDNEKYMGDALMGKWVIINGIQYANRDGQYGKRYYMEDTHEGIVSKETFRRAQEIRNAQRNTKKLGQPLPVYTFTGKIECGQCGTHYRHKIGNSGKKWQSPIWACGTYLRYGVAACDCTRVKESILEEKFVEAYNEFIREKPEGYGIEAMQAVAAELRQEERDLAELHMKKLIPESAFREEQRRIKQQVAALNAEINEQRGKAVRESDYTYISEFDPEKAERFISKIIMHRNIITFVFYNGVKISKAYTNGPAGNRRGWREKQQEEIAWQ